MLTRPRSTSHLLLALALLAMTTLLLLDAPNYLPAVRLFPLIILGLLAALLALAALAEVAPGIGRALERHARVELTDVKATQRRYASERGAEAGEVAEDADDGAQGAHGADGPGIGDDDAQARARVVRSAAFVAWTVGLLAAVAVVGFLYALPPFLVGFWLVQAGSVEGARRALPRAALLTVAAMAFVYVVFFMVLGLPLERPAL